jgi:hypothetical protein
MSFRSTLRSVRWSTMDVSVTGRSIGAAVADDAAPSYNLAKLCQASR